MARVFREDSRPLVTAEVKQLIGGHDSDSSDGGESSINGELWSLLSDWRAKSRPRISTLVLPSGNCFGNAWRCLGQ